MHRPRVLLLVTLVFLALALPSWAGEGFLGKWEATIETPRGTNDVTMEFKGSDEELQGTFTGQRGTEELEDVEVTDGKLTFVRNLEFQGNAISLSYAATVDGDTMNLTVTTPRGSREFTAKRMQ